MTGVDVDVAVIWVRVLGVEEVKVLACGGVDVGSGA
jgi:hypothetical protein